MIADLYGAAGPIYLAVTGIMGIAILSGLLANYGGTQRIAVVLAIVAGAFMVLPNLIDWQVHGDKVHIVINILASAPLLVRPKTAYQQTIAAWFIACGTLHIAFYFLVPISAASVIVQWFGSISIDAVQALLLLTWSGPHAREAIGRHFRHRDGVASPPSTVRTG